MQRLVPGTLLVLGSASPHRQRVLREAGVRAVQMSPDIDEKSIRDGDPAVLTRKLASAKAFALLRYLDFHAVLITCDQVLEFGGEIREKPASVNQARQWLRQYGEGGPITVYTSMAIASRAWIAEDQPPVGSLQTDVCRIRFGRTPEAAIEEALAAGTVLGTAGAVAIEDPSLAPCIVALEAVTTTEPLRDCNPGSPMTAEDMHRDVRTSILGLPIGLLLRELTHLQLIEDV